MLSPIRPAEQQRILWNNLLIGLGVLDRSKRWLRINPSLCHLLEYTDIELINTDILDVMLRPDAEAVNKGFEDLATGKSSYFLLAAQLVTKTNNVIWVKVRVDSAMDEMSRAAYYVIQITPAHAVSVRNDQGHDVTRAPGAGPDLRKESSAWTLVKIGGSIVQFTRDFKLVVALAGSIIVGAGLGVKHVWEQATLPLYKAVQQATAAAEQVQEAKDGIDTTLEGIKDLIEHQSKRLDLLEKND